jgi:hypothetical protein
MVQFGDTVDKIYSNGVKPNKGFNGMVFSGPPPLAVISLIEDSRCVNLAAQRCDFIDISPEFYKCVKNAPIEGIIKTHLNVQSIYHHRKREG